MKISGIEISEEAKGTKRDLKTKTILAPINNTEGSSKTSDFAIELAQHWQADLCIMYVYTGLPRVSGATDLRCAKHRLGTIPTLGRAIQVS